MKKTILPLLAAAALIMPAAALAQTAVQVQPISGTRLDISATGEVTRVPDVAIISTGVVTRAPTATGAIRQNAARMERVRSALRQAGVADKDIQTSSLSLNPEYHYEQNKAPRLTGYQASNQVSVRFRDIGDTGKILDALVAEGANQISGPSLTIDKPEEALDEARLKAIANGRARADLYARALGMRVVRLLSVSEGGGYAVPPPMPMYARAEAASMDAQTKIDPGEQKVQVGVNMSFELQ
jgi:uncharacterized protein YggE